MAEETTEFETDSFVHGYHVCWTLVIGAAGLLEGRGKSK